MNKPEFAPEYFYDEIRNGFYIPEMMKRFWAAQLIVLYEIVRICDRHDIVWYADMGTLLGAVRHKGYVPWDDDLDISMKREDWERFFEYAPRELPEGYQVLSIRTNENYTLSVGRITNSDSINTNREFLEKNAGCPYVAGVDVYPIDRLYRDPVKEAERKQRAKAVRKAIKLIEEQGLNSEECKKALADIERSNHTTLRRKGNIVKQLVHVFEDICMECKDEDYEQVALMATWLLYDWANCPRRLYEERREFIFENTCLLGTAVYDELLTIYYHDYMTVKKGGGAHDYPVYNPQEKLLKQSIGHNPYRYTFDVKAIKEGRNKMGKRARRNEMIRLLMEAADYCEKCEADERNELLQECQETAIALGSSLEERYGEGTEAVRQLEEYCELVYGASEEWTMETACVLKEKVRKITKELGKLMNEVLFIAVRKEWWDSMKSLYEKYIADPEMKVRLLNVPYYDKDPMGNIGQKHDDSEFFSSMKGYISMDEYINGAVHPSILVMQMPFDEYSRAVTTDEMFYSSSLAGKADELWYVPGLNPDPPVSENDKAYVALSTLAEQPVMVNADKVILDSEEMRTFYIKKLIELTGEENREYWESKIEVL